MTTDTASRSTTGRSALATSSLWIAGVAALCVGGSYVYACAAPFAAIAAIGATRMDRNTGLMLVIVAWLVNQVIGFAVLDYPHTATTFAWGIAIGIAAIVGYAAARTIATAGQPPVLTLALTFVAAFVIYETALYAASFALGGSDYAFTIEIVGYILKINAAAFAVLLILHRTAIALPWLRRAAPEPTAA